MKKVLAASVFWLCGLTMAAEPVLIGLDAEFGHKTCWRRWNIDQPIEF